MASKYKAPPEWEEGKIFEKWQDEVQLWLLVTDLEEAKRGPALALSLSGRKREIALDIPPTELTDEGGVQKLLDTLKAVFARDEVDQFYECYVNFETITRSNGRMTDYIQNFERASNELSKKGVVLPTSILACKLLYSANLEENERRMVLSATSKLEYEPMKSSLRRIFGSVVSNSDGPGPVVKAEPAFVGQDVQDGEPENEGVSYWSRGGRGGRYNMRGSYRGRGSFVNGQRNRGMPRQSGTNQILRDGSIAQCYKCGSRYHLVRDCPESTETVEVSKTNKPDVDERQFFTFASITKSLVHECREIGIIDTGCTKSVAGDIWYQAYLKTLTPTLQKQVQTLKSYSSIRFGSGDSVRSTRICKLPVFIGGVQCSLEVEIIPGDLPLLISVKSLKAMGAVIHTGDSKMLVSNLEVLVDLVELSTGHLGLSLSSQIAACSFFAREPESLTNNELLKLHRQFGHSSAFKMRSFLRNIRPLTKTIERRIDEVCDNCDVCVKFGRPACKPAVSLPMATKFNETVAMDLHQLDKGEYYLHMIDLFTRYSRATIIGNKFPETIIESFLTEWVTIFGVPHSTLTDNGGEFDNCHFRSMAENYGIKLTTTAAYSPWSNGICERHNSALTETYNKLRSDTSFQLSKGALMRYACLAKNSLLNQSGFTPQQLVFGENPSVPTVMSSDVPALENVTTSRYIRDHLNVLSKSRQAYLSIESSDRLKRALKAKTRLYSGPYSAGERVYFRKGDDDEWHGPGVVLGMDSRTIALKHGGSIFKVHESRVRRSPVTFGNDKSESAQDNAELKTPVSSNDVSQEDSDCEDSAGSSNSRDTTAAGDCPEESFDSDISDRDVSAVENSIPKPPAYNGDSVFRGSKALPKVKEKIRFTTVHDYNSGKDYEATVVSRAGKSSGRHKNWMNVQYSSPDSMNGQMGCIDFENDVASWSVKDDIQSLIASGEQRDEFAAAKLAELESWRQHDVYTEEEDIGQTRVSTRWVLTTKDDGRRKARLVARGFEEKDSVELTDSPTCSKESFRLLLQLLISNADWFSQVIDVKTAFLQGESLQRDVYLDPPKGYCTPGVVWKLNNCVYGLVDASLHWYKRVKKELQQLGCKASASDPCMFYYRVGGELHGVLCVHVDDFWLAGTGKFKQNVCEKLRDVFVIGDVKSIPCRYLGLDIKRQSNCIVIDMSSYVHEKLDEIPIDSARMVGKGIPLDEYERERLRSMLGKLQWVATQACPNLCFYVSSLCGRISTAVVGDIISVNKIIRTLKSGVNLSLTYVNLGDINSWKIISYADASFANLSDGGTQGGYITVIAAGGNCGVISWQSRKIRRIVRSTLAAETIACIDGADSGYLLSTLLGEIAGVKIPVVCVSDSRSLVGAVKSTTAVLDKRLRIDISYLRNMLERNEISGVDWTETQYQAADGLTKHSALINPVIKSICTGRLPKV